MMLLLLLIFALGHPRITSCNSRVTSRSGQKHCQGWWWDDAALTSQFYQGLKDNVKDDIVRGERPDTLQEMIATAVKINNRLYERQLEKGEHRYPVPFRPKPKPNPARTRQYPP